MIIYSPEISGSVTISGSLTIQGAATLTASLATSASYALTASYALNGGGTTIDTGSFVTTSSFNTFTSSINSATSSFVTNSQTSSFLTTGSSSVSQTISGSLIINQNLTVLGSSSILYVTSSQLNIGTNLITVNANTPAVRYGGLSVIDSGSSPQRSGSILFDSTNNQWIFVHQNTAGAVTSSVFIQGPQTFNNIGSETTLTTNRIPKASGGDLGEHIGDSNITDTGTIVSINSNTQITGSLIVTSSMVIGSSSLGPNENTLTLGARDAVQEGGQLGFSAAGGSFTSASMIDLYQNRLRILKGTNAGSTAEVAWWSMHNLQMALPGYNSVTAFAGSTVAGLGVDSSGNITTTRISDASVSVLPTLGSTIKAEPIWGGFQNYTGTSNQLVNQRLIAQPVYLPAAATLTGVKFFITVSGSYTAANYNGVGLYTLSGATLTCVASSSNNPNLFSSSLWTAGAFASASFGFGANYNATPGLYYIALLHSNSAFTLLPSVGQQLATLGNTSTFDFTAGVKHTFTFASQASMPISIAMGASQIANGNNLYVTLY